MKIAFSHGSCQWKYHGLSISQNVHHPTSFQFYAVSALPQYAVHDILDNDTMNRFQPAGTYITTLKLEQLT